MIKIIDFLSTSSYNYNREMVTEGGEIVAEKLC